MKYLRAIVSVIMLVCFDQYTKFMVVTHLPLHTYHPVLGDVFGLYYLQNQGMAWGMFQQKQLIFLIFTVIVLVFAVYIYKKLLTDSFFRPLNACILFLISGAIGNMIDRMFRGEFLHGGVVDFLYIKCIDFPVFNVADMYVTISIFFIILLMIIRYRNVDFESILRMNSKETQSNPAFQNIEQSGSDDTEASESVTHTVQNDASQSNNPSVSIDDMFLNEEEEDE